MNEFLIALAAMANVVTALLSLWREYKHQRDGEDRQEGLAATSPSSC